MYSGLAMQTFRASAASLDNLHKVDLISLAYLLASVVSPLPRLVASATVSLILAGQTITLGNNLAELYPKSLTSRVVA